MSGSGLEALPVVRVWSGRGSRMFGSGQEAVLGGLEALPYVREWS